MNAWYFTVKGTDFLYTNNRLIYLPHHKTIQHYIPQYKPSRTTLRRDANRYLVSMNLPIIVEHNLP